MGPRTSWMPFTPLATMIQYWTHWFYIPSQHFMVKEMQA